MKFALPLLVFALAAHAQQTVNLPVGQSVTITAVPAVSQPGANLAAASQLPVSYTCATNLYVNGATGSDSNAGSATSPFKTIARATWQDNTSLAGVCIQVAPGTYSEYVWVKDGTSQQAGGAPGAPLVLHCTGTKGSCKIVGPTTYNESVVTLPASYVVVDGFDVSGGQTQNGAHCIDGGYNWQNGNNAHHLTVVNSTAHGCGGAGISMVGGDYYTIVGNIVYGNAGTNWNQASGISIASAFAMAADSPDPYYHNVVAYNVSYNNLETFSCSTAGMGSGCHSDGEGIIVDCFACVPLNSNFQTYTARTLVIGNVTYGNGGNGIQVGRSNNVIVANNSSYNNMQDPQNGGSARAEIGNYRGSNNIFVNNIAQAVASNDYSMLDEGAGSQDQYYAATGNLWTNNLYYGGKGLGNAWADGNGTIDLVASANIAANPLYTAPASANFTLQTGSPAIGKSFPEGWLTSGAPNIGAY